MSMSQLTESVVRLVNAADDIRALIRGGYLVASDGTSEVLNRRSIAELSAALEACILTITGIDAGNLAPRWER